MFVIRPGITKINKNYFENVLEHQSGLEITLVQTCDGKTSFRCLMTNLPLIDL